MTVLAPFIFRTATFARYPLLVTLATLEDEAAVGKETVNEIAIEITIILEEHPAAPGIIKTEMVILRVTTPVRLHGQHLRLKRYVMKIYLFIANLLTFIVSFFLSGTQVFDGFTDQSEKDPQT